MDWCKRIVRRDKSGRVIAIGVEWTEFNIWAAALDALVDGVCAIVGFVMALAGVLAIISSALWLVVAAIGIALCVLPVVRRPFDLWRKPRSVIFHRDGRVELPEGFPYHSSIREMSQPHREIVSIEARAAYRQALDDPIYKHDVAVFRRDGDIVHVAWRLRADEAHKVAVQLTHALAEIRALESVGARRAGVNQEAALPIN